MAPSSLHLLTAHWGPITWPSRQNPGDKDGLGSTVPISLRSEIVSLFLFSKSGKSDGVAWIDCFDTRNVDRFVLVFIAFSQTFCGFLMVCDRNTANEDRADFRAYLCVEILREGFRPRNSYELPVEKYLAH